MFQQTYFHDFIPSFPTPIFAVKDLKKMEIIILLDMATSFFTINF